MRRVLFVLWLLVVLAMLFGVGSLLHSPAELGTSSFLIVSAIWLEGVVPASFAVWLRLQHRHEQEVVATALRSLSEGAPNAGPLLAEATQEAIADEDALRRLLEVLKTRAPGKVGPALEPLLRAANEWLADDGGHSSRNVGQRPMPCEDAESAALQCSDGQVVEVQLRFPAREPEPVVPLALERHRIIEAHELTAVDEPHQQ